MPKLKIIFKRLSLTYKVYAILLVEKSSNWSYCTLDLNIVLFKKKKKQYLNYVTRANRNSLRENKFIINY